MNAAMGPVLSIRADETVHTFSADHDVVIGSDPRADVRVFRPPLVSSGHLFLLCDNGRWLAIDMKSRRGTFVAGRRARVIEIHDGQRIHLGGPDGPELSCGLGRCAGYDHQTAATAPLQTVPIPRHPGSEETAGWATIGRASDNDIVVNNSLTSRRHAFLMPTQLGTEIWDARSVNGTFVNGIRVGSATLRDGDVVTIGDVDLRFTGTTLVS